MKSIKAANGDKSFLEKTCDKEDKSNNPTFHKTNPKDGDANTEQNTTDFSNLYAQDLLPTKNDEENTMKFLMEVVKIILNYIRKTFDRTSKILDFHHPHQLLEELDGFNLKVNDYPEPLEQLLDDCRDTLKYGVKTGHPRFFNQLSTGLDIIGLAGEWLTAAANTNMFTYEIAPVFTIMEDIVLKKMFEMVGWSHAEADGIFSPGGTISNLYSMLVARYKRFPEVKTQGAANLPKLVLFTSEFSHYSIKKAAAVLGIGTENVILVKCDERGKIIPAELEAKICEAQQKGFVPFYVNATAGTTVYGAFDPLSEIADLCEKYSLWMHVDAAWGGGLLMSRSHRYKMKGIERANSVTWNPHKIMGIPLQCSAILIQEKGLLQGCNKMSAEYLFQTDKPYNISYDTGDKTIQCGRHVDIFKFWLIWKAKKWVGSLLMVSEPILYCANVLLDVLYKHSMNVGTLGFEKQINQCLELADYLHSKLKCRTDFKLVFEEKPEHTNVCFWYIPPSLQGMPENTEKDKILHQIAPKIKARMMEAGLTMVGYQPQGDQVNFFRMVISNPATNKSDIDFLIEEIVKLGEDL